MMHLSLAEVFMHGVKPPRLYCSGITYGFLQDLPGWTQYGVVGCIFHAPIPGIMCWNLIPSVRHRGWKLTQLCGLEMGPWGGDYGHKRSSGWGPWLNSSGLTGRTENQQSHVHSLYPPCDTLCHFSLFQQEGQASKKTLRSTSRGICQNKPLSLQLLSHVINNRNGVIQTLLASGPYSVQVYMACGTWYILFCFLMLSWSRLGSWVEVS